MQIFMATFTAIDAVGEGWWQCRSNGERCVGNDGVCSLGIEQIAWTHKEWSVVSDFGLICDDSWKVSS